MYTRSLTLAHYKVARPVCFNLELKQLRNDCATVGFRITNFVYVYRMSAHCTIRITRAATSSCRVQLSGRGGAKNNIDSIIVLKLASYGCYVLRLQKLIYVSVLLQIQKLRLLAVVVVVVVAVAWSPSRSTQFQAIQVKAKHIHTYSYAQVRTYGTLTCAYTHMHTCTYTHQTLYTNNTSYIVY
jgi:hypothetical protein